MVGTPNPVGAGWVVALREPSWSTLWGQERFSPRQGFWLPIHHEGFGEIERGQAIGCTTLARAGEAGIDDVACLGVDVHQQCLWSSICSGHIHLVDREPLAQRAHVASACFGRTDHVGIELVIGQ